METLSIFANVPIRFQSIFPLVLVLPLTFDFITFLSLCFADSIEWIWIHPFMLLSAVLNMPSNCDKVFIDFIHNEWIETIFQVSMHFSLWVLVLPLPFDFTIFFSFSFRFADPIEWIWIHPFMLLSAVLNMPSNYGKVLLFSIILKFIMNGLILSDNDCRIRSVANSSFKGKTELFQRLDIAHH